tara:strand:+ start:1643 stop:2914 length:1272 start_codon:yes stop_codon:yes gene_type:complete
MSSAMKSVPHLGKIPTDWKLGRIYDVVDALESGISVNGHARTPSDDEPAVLKVSAVTYGTFNQSASKPILGNDLKRAKCTPKSGQVIISRASGSAKHVGACAYVDRDYPNRYLSDKLWQTVTKAECKVSTKWLLYVLASARIKEKIRNLATGTNIKNITKEEFLSLPIGIPTFDEQCTIANLLSTWDEAIEKTEQLIQAKTIQYKHIVRELIKRTACHEEIELKQFAEPINTKNSVGDKNVLTSSARDGLISQLEYYNKSVSAEDVSGYYRIEKGDFAYNRSSATGYPFGAIKRLDRYQSGVLSTLYLCFRLTNMERVDSSYLGDLFEAGVLNGQLRRVCQAGARSHGLLNITKADFFSLKVPLPSIEAQREIATKLGLARKEIEFLGGLKEKYTEQKRGLMQKLLTGEWRVNTDQKETDTCA